MATAATRVVVRPPTWVIVGGLILLPIFIVGITWGIVDALRFGWAYPFRDAQVSGPGMVIGWIVVFACYYASVFGFIAVVRFREVFLPDRIMVRRSFSHHDVWLGDVQQIRTTIMRTHTGGSPRQTYYPRLVIYADQGRRPRRAMVDSDMRNGYKALDVLDGWIRLRPDLAADEGTRQLFRSRGVLPD